MFSINSRRSRYPINFLIDLAFTFSSALYLLSPVDVDSKLTAVTNFQTIYAKRLFVREGTRDLPSESDPAIVSASARLQICNDVSRSGVFAAYGMNPVDMTEMYEELRQPKYSDTFDLIYKTRRHRNGRLQVVYVNPYRSLDIEISEYFPGRADTESRIIWKKEYAFMCLAEMVNSSDNWESEEDDSWEDEDLEDFSNNALTNESGSAYHSDEGDFDRVGVEENDLDEQIGDGERTVSEEASSEENFPRNAMTNESGSTYHTEEEGVEENDSDGEIADGESRVNEEAFNQGDRENFAGFAIMDGSDPYPNDEESVERRNLSVDAEETDNEHYIGEGAVYEEAFGKEGPGDIVRFYVSKLYDVHRGLHAHRFILLEKRNTEEKEIVALLAAESARAHLRSDFNVELHYIELRKHHQPARNCRQDPVCKLTLGRFGENRLFQLCATVLSSSYFVDRVQYPGSAIHARVFWFIERVFFRTREGFEIAGGKFYKEFVVPCYAETIDGDEKAFYISRAYNPSQVFVFTKDPLSDELYLKNLTTDVGIVHELYNFGDVEI